jgi:transcriptional antiterminator RfaH
MRVTPDPRAWFCVRTQPKHEHIAATHLRQEAALEVFLPRIRFKRLTRQGLRWTTEALFPGYMFARFDLAACLRRVQHTRGVRAVVHFGRRWPAVPGAVLQELRARVGSQEVYVLVVEPEPGDQACIAGGVFQGLEAVITRVMPGKERVAVLLSFLGRQTTVELDRSLLVLEKDDHRMAL